jgi:hypothetical protein
MIHQYTWNGPLHQRQHMWYMHDGASPHFVRIVTQHLFGEQWIGRGGPVSWPARSPDLNPLDLLLWRHLKSLVYWAPINGWKRYYSNEYRMPVRGIEWKQELQAERTPVCDEELKVVLQCMGITYTAASAEEITRTSPISAGDGFWTCVHWDDIAHLSELL